MTFGLVLQKIIMLEYGVNLSLEEADKYDSIQEAMAYFETQSKNSPEKIIRRFIKKNPDILSQEKEELREKFRDFIGSDLRISANKKIWKKLLEKWEENKANGSKRISL